MIKLKKRNPDYSNNFKIENLKLLKPSQVYSQLFSICANISNWTNGAYMRDNHIHERRLTEWLKIKQAFEPYLPKENKKIYRSVVGLDKKEYGYYCNLDAENTIIQTAIKPLQNWSYSKNFTDKWGDNNYKGHVKIVFQSNTKKLRDNIIFDPKTILLYFAKISKLFPNDFNRLRKEKASDLDFTFTYLNSEAKELLLYSPNGDLFIEKMEVYGC